MSDLHANSGALPDHNSLLGASADSTREPPEPALPRGSAGCLAGWQTIGEQRDFYDEQDCLDPTSHNLASDELKNRKEDDVVIFDYFLDPDYLTCASGNPNPPVEEGCPSKQFSPDNGIFFQVSKNELIKSKQFDRIINSPPLSEGGPRLGVM